MANANPGFNDDENVLADHLIPMSKMGIAELDAAIEEMKEGDSIQITKNTEGSVTRYTIKEDAKEVGEIIFNTETNNIYYKIIDSKTEKDVYIKMVNDKATVVEPTNVGGGRRKRRSTKRNRHNRRNRRTKHRSRKN